MNTYNCCYRNACVTIDAVNTHSAQLQAAEYFRARRHADVTVTLVAKVGKPAKATV